MAEQEDIIVRLRVESSEAVNNITTLKKQMDELKTSTKGLKEENKTLEKSMKDLSKGGKTSSDEYKTLEKQLKENSKQITLNELSTKSLGQTVQSNSKTLLDSINAHEKAQGSLAQLRAQLSVLTSEYVQMSKAERESAAGQELQQKIKATTDALKQEEKAYGDTRRSVGNYEDSVRDAINGSDLMNNSVVRAGKGLLGMMQSAGGLSGVLRGAFTGAINTVLGALNKLLAHPIVLLIAVVVGAIIGLTKVIKGNEEQLERLQVLFAPVKAFLDFSVKILQGVADVLITVVEWVGKAAGGLATMMESLPFIGDAVKEANEAAREAIQLEKDKQSLEEDNRANQVKEAKTEQEVVLLRQKSYEKQKYTAKERLAFLDEAAKKELEQAQTNKKLKEEELRILESEASRNKNSEEINDKIAQTRAEVIKMETQGYEQVLSLQRRRQTFIGEISAEEQKAAEDRKRRAEEYNAIVIEGAKRVRDLTISLMEEGKGKELAELKEKYDEELKAVKGSSQQKAQIRKLLEEQYKQEQAAIDEKYNQEALDKETECLEQELSMKLELSKGNIDERLKLELERIEMEKQSALTAAQETGVSKDLINSVFKQRADEASLTAEEEKKTKRADALSSMMGDIEDGYAKELQAMGDNEAAKAALQAEIEQEKLDALLSMDETQKTAMFESEEAFQEAVREQFAITTAAELNSMELAKKAQIKSAQDKLGSLSTLAGGISDLFNELAGDNEEMQKFSKAVAVFQIGLNMAQGLAGAVAGAMAVPFPANLAAIVSGIMAVTTGIISAKKALSQEKEAKAPKFATGGVVQGLGTGTSDSIHAMVSSGESVINARSTSMFSPLLSAINQVGGGVPFSLSTTAMNLEGGDTFQRSIELAMKTMPNPIVSVAEINRVGLQVSVNETLRV